MTPDQIELLENIVDYFSNRSDFVDGDYGIPEPNQAAVFAAKLEDLIRQESAP